MLLASAVVVWEWLNEHGRWRPYSPAVSHHIEAVARAGPRAGGSVVLGQADSRLAPYIIDLQSMHQFRQDTGESARGGEPPGGQPHRPPPRPRRCPALPGPAGPCAGLPGLRLRRWAPHSAALFPAARGSPAWHCTVPSAPGRLALRCAFQRRPALPGLAPLARCRGALHGPAPGPSLHRAAGGLLPGPVLPCPVGCFPA